MASAKQKSEAEEAVQCMICMEYDGFLKCDIKLIHPCSHVLCTECLLNLSSVSNEDHPCKTCRAVTAQTVENLPSASRKPSEEKEQIILCHVCVKKNEKVKLKADMYCYDCDNVFCDHHSGSHYDIYPEHKVVEIAVYIRSIKKLEKRFCSEHKEQELSFGCPGCYKTFCIMCLPENTQCTNGGGHKFTVLDTLQRSLIKELDGLRVEAQQRENEADKLVKDTMIGLEKWDKKTEELVSQLHEARDKHVDRVMAEYGRLETELVKHRGEGRTEIEEFLEKKAEQTHIEIVRKLQINDERIASYHQVEFIEKYEESLQYLKVMTTTILPVTELTEDVPSLDVKETGELRVVIELTTDNGEMIAIGKLEEEISAFLPQLPPSGLKFVREVKTDCFCSSVCYYKGYTYVGQAGGAIDRINKQGKVDKAFIKLDSIAIAIAAYNDQLFSLMFGYVKSRVHIHSLQSRQRLRSWAHPNFGGFGQRIVVMRGYNQLAVGDWCSKQIIIYSLTGDVIRKVPCPPSLTMIALVCMSSCGEDSVVISDRLAGKVVRMSLKDGSLLWSSDGVTYPGGIVHHPAGYVLVVSNYVDNTTIYVLDEKDGKLVTVLVDETPRAKTFSHDLCLYDDILVVLRDDESVVMYEITY